MSTVLYSGNDKQTVGDAITLSDSIANYSLLTFIVTLYEDHTDTVVTHNIHKMLTPGETTIEVQCGIDTIVATWELDIKTNTSLQITDKTVTGWTASECGISKIIGYT